MTNQNDETQIPANQNQLPGVDKQAKQQQAFELRDRNDDPQGDPQQVDHRDQKRRNRNN